MHPRLPLPWTPTGGPPPFTGWVGSRRYANQSCPNTHFPEGPPIRMLISPPLSCGLDRILAGPWCCPSHGTPHVEQTPSINIKPLPFSSPNSQHRCLWGNFFLEVARFPPSSSTKVNWLYSWPDFIWTQNYSCPHEAGIRSPGPPNNSHPPKSMMELHPERSH